MKQEKQSPLRAGCSGDRGSGSSPAHLGFHPEEEAGRGQHEFERAWPRTGPVHQMGKMNDQHQRRNAANDADNRSNHFNAPKALA